MKKIFSLIFSLALLALVATPALAVYVFPSTNQLNKDKLVPGREGQLAPYVNLVEASIGKVKLDFVGGHSGTAYFEYRIDGAIKTSGTVHPITGDFIYSGVSVAANTVVQRELTANSYVEVRLALGGERDWDFDWTRFDVLPVPFVRSATINSPTVDQLVSGTVNFTATLNDKDGNDNVQWAVRKGTCTAGTNTVLGNVDGFLSPYTWNGADFNATADTSSWIPGNYCFIFNPTESAGDTPIRETREFVLKDTKAPLVTINSPLEGDVVSDVVEIFGTVLDDYILSHYNIAVYPGNVDYNDFSKRIVQSTVYLTDSFTNESIFLWDSNTVTDGEYLIRLAARDAAGNRSYSGDPLQGGDDSQHVIRVTVKNTPDEPVLTNPPTDMNQCKKDGWMTFNNPTFKNQGQCVSYVQSNEKAGKRN